jgi:threonylcarbamoyladenosine tRNA methylthiotransferase MtaB
MRIHFITLGCKTNQYDSEAMRESLVRSGHAVTESSEACDAVVVNACAVTASACAQARQIVRRFTQKPQKPFLAVVGCYPQTYPLDLGEIAEVDLILGTAEKYQLGEYLEKGTRGIFASDPLTSTTFNEVPIDGHHNHTRAFLKIQEGCDQECAYCVVPRARGRSRNRDLFSIVEEAKRLVSRGYLEVVLTGTHLEEDPLFQVLVALESVEGLKRIRVSSLDPNEVSERLLKRMAASNSVARHLHIAVQSGDDRILASMKRPYRAQDVHRTLVRVKSVLGEGVGLGTDVLVGFPGEDEEAFEKTFQLIQEFPFTYLHLFPFSPRPGTEAAAMKPPVSQAKVKERLAALKRLGEVKKKSFQEYFLGRTLETLVENRKEARAHCLTGLTGNYLRIGFEGGEEMKGKLINVEITEIAGTALRGRPV